MRRTCMQPLLAAIATVATMAGGCARPASTEPSPDPGVHVIAPESRSYLVDPGTRSCFALTASDGVPVDCRRLRSVDDDARDAISWGPSMEKPIGEVSRSAPRGRREEPEYSLYSGDEQRTARRCCGPDHATYPFEGPWLDDEPDAASPGVASGVEDARRLAAENLERAIRKIDETTFEVDWELLSEAVTSDPVRLLTTSETHPVESPPYGIRLERVAIDSLWARLGFRSGDVVESLNGRPLTSNGDMPMLRIAVADTGRVWMPFEKDPQTPAEEAAREALSEALWELAQADLWTVVVLRDGQRIEMTYRGP